MFRNAISVDKLHLAITLKNMPNTDQPGNQKQTTKNQQPRRSVSEDADTILIPLHELKSTLYNILIKAGLPSSQAQTCAEIFATNSLEGVYSHGVNRFPKFIEYLKAGNIKAGSQAVCKNRIGSLEQWDGQSGPGPVNAMICAERAMELAREYGMGCVTLANTNHWLRGGTYGWKAAKAGFAYIAWSNTIANMPAWGATDRKLGNNPVIIAVPHGEEAIVLDMALSQYSFGALEMKKQKNEQLPLPGGYDKQGNLTTDPASIMESWRPLPIGYWKGAGLSLLLDVLATILSGGLSTAQITAAGPETRLSQVFIAIDISKLHNYTTIAASINAILTDYASSIPERNGARIRYPGEQVVEIRKENLKKGVPVLRKTWELVLRSG
ncbi:MAG: 3-dehydro-L-gulonate 2-dehydrogenase [Cyclobacteriaceae bacterium]